MEGEQKGEWVKFTKVTIWTIFLVKNQFFEATCENIVIKCDIEPAFHKTDPCSVFLIPKGSGKGSRRLVEYVL